MTSKTISLKGEAYKRLKELKEEGKSFSDVVLNLTRESKRDFSNLIGADLKIGWKEVKEERKRKREDGDREKVLLRH